MKLTVSGRVQIADYVLIELTGQEISASLGVPVCSRERRLTGIRAVSSRGTVRAVKSLGVSGATLSGQVVTMNEEV